MLEMNPDIIQFLKGHYNGRPYHNFTHILEVLQQFSEIPDHMIIRPDDIVWAILFHDIVYSTSLRDNEEQSASLAIQEIPNYAINDNYDLRNIAGLIRLTALHGKISDRSLSEDAKLFLDCDMSILGSEPSRFEEYCIAIREEYNHVPDALFHKGRTAFFHNLLRTEAIYHSQFFYSKFEQLARKNIKNWLKSQEEGNGVP